MKKKHNLKARVVQVRKNNLLTENMWYTSAPYAIEEIKADLLANPTNPGCGLIQIREMPEIFTDYLGKPLSKLPHFNSEIFRFLFFRYHPASTPPALISVRPVQS